MTIDQVRRYWDSRPCNIKHSPVDIDEDPLAYSKQVTERKRFVEPDTLWFPRFFEWNGKRVLELGCGIGTDTLDFARCGADVVAVDISSKSIQIAAKRAIAEGIKPGRILWGIGDIEKKLFPLDARDWASFDLVYSFGVIHHTPNPDRAVSWAMSYLKYGGTFKLMLYYRYSTKVLRILAKHPPDLLFRRKSIDQIVALESEAQSGCPITYTYTKESARQLLENCGFQVQSMEITHIFPYSIPHYKRYKYKRAFPWNIIKGPLFRWMEARFGWHLLITAIKP